MQDFLFSQNYSVYKDLVIGTGKDQSGRTIFYTMGHDGCLLTCMDTIVSYYNNRAMTPDQFFHWAAQNKLITPDARMYFNAPIVATNNHLRFNTLPKPKPGEVTYGIRQLAFGPLGHFVVDHPRIANMVIDPLDGKVKPYNYYPSTGHPYTNHNLFYMGRPL